jgi:O-antigen/teichoic acid export membrane protein
MLRMILELLSVILAYFLNLNIYMLIILIGGSYLIPLLTNKTFFSKIADGKIVGDLKIGKFVFVKNISNIKFDFPASIFSMISIYLPIVYFFISGDKVFSGIYFAINRFIGAPSLLIAQSFGTTLKQYAAEEYRNFNHCTRSTIKGLKIVFIYMLPIYLLGGLAFFILFKYLLSQEWKGIISTGWMLLPLFVLRYFFNCFANIVYVKGLFKENMLFQIISAIVAFFALFLPNTLSEKVIYFSVSMSIYYLIYLLYLLKVSLTK